MTEQEIADWRARAQAAAADPAQVDARFSVARTTAEVFEATGIELYAIGDTFGSDRIEGRSPGKHGSDEVVAVSILLRVAAQLVSACADLFRDGRHYAAAALLRQLVEVEYLAWAFDTRDNDAERWLRSTAEERREFFSPSKLRQAANGKFRGVDYGHHCEMGGHPVPRSAILLRGDDTVCQLLLSDLLGHTGRTWDHLSSWSTDQPWALPMRFRREPMQTAYSAWKRIDTLSEMPPPP